MNRCCYFIILFLSLSYAAETQEYYQSNKIGMEIKKINQFRILDYEYYIEKHTDDLKVVKRLYSGNRLIREWEILYSENRKILKETVTENTSATVKIYDNNTVVKEEYYENRMLTNFKKYVYDDKNILSRIEEYDLSGTLRTVTDFERDYKGYIKSMTKYEYDDGTNMVSAMSKYRFTGTDILEEWHGSDEGTGVFIFYNHEGKLEKIINKTDNRIVSEKNYFYERGVLLKTEEKVLQSKEKIVLKYDNGSRISEEEYFINNISDRKVFNYYEDSTGEVTRRIIVKGRNTERYLYFYDQSDITLLKEEYYLNGQLLKETVYTDMDNYYEDYYLKGIRYMRIYYKNSEKISTERW